MLIESARARAANPTRTTAQSDDIKAFVNPSRTLAIDI
jgi:hypothetical protein